MEDTSFKTVFTHYFILSLQLNCEIPEDAAAVWLCTPLPTVPQSSWDVMNNDTVGEDLPSLSEGGWVSGRMTTFPLGLVPPQPGLFSLVTAYFFSRYFKFVVNDKSDITTLQQIWIIYP